MTLFQLVILPGILIAGFLGGVLFLAARFTLARIREMKAPPELIRKQAEVIDAVIYEIETNRLSYKGIFPEELMTELTDMHTLYQRKKIR
jgi:hypothetical protein